MANYSRISMAQLEARLTERVGNNTVFWLSPEKRYALNEAVRVWAALTGQWSRTFQMPTLGGVFYNTPKQLVSIQRVRYNLGSPLEPVSLWELDNGVSNWQNAANGTPTMWTPIGLNGFAIYPPAAVGNTLYLDGVALAPAMIAGGDNIDIGDEEVTRILDYAHHYLAFKEGGAEFVSTIPLYASFIEAASQRNARLNASALFRKFIGMARDEQERPARQAGEMGARA